MALSRGTIQFNFQKARQQADRLDELAGRLTKLTASEYAGAMQNISANWKGENASAYLSKGARLQGDMEETAKSLHNVASEIRAVARRIYDAEMRALAIAEARRYRS